VALAAALSAWAQPAPPSLKVSFPADSPLAPLSVDSGGSRADARGGAMVLDLHTALTLRNSSQRRIRGVTLLVQAQEFSPGGRGSVAVPSLDVRPGETFPVRIDLRLLRPLVAGGGPLAEVSLDGVLFDDLSFYGPDRLSSRRSMTIWELEARRDRRYFKSVLEARGPAGLQREIVESLDRMAPRLDVQVIRRGRSTVWRTSRGARHAPHASKCAIDRTARSATSRLAGSSRIGKVASSWQAPCPPRVPARNSRPGPAAKSGRMSR
jgi:hypothetical protein